MKSLLKTRKPLSKKDIIYLSVILVLACLLILSSLTIIFLRSVGFRLRAEKNELNGKVSTLQTDLKSIGERLSGKAAADEKAKNENSQNQVQALNRIGLIATPGETTLSVDAPTGWELQGENRLRSGGSTVAVQSEEIDLLSLSNYQVSRTVESFTLKSGQTVFLVFIKTTEDNKGYLSLSFCNPDVGLACSFRGRDGKYVFILAHGYKEQDQFVRDMDFNTVEGIKLITDFKTMMKSLEIG